MGYVTQHALRGSKGRMCYDKYDDMEKFANTMMEFDEFIEKDPLQIDYTALDSTAKAELLKVLFYSNKMQQDIFTVYTTYKNYFTILLGRIPLGSNRLRLPQED